MTVKAVSQNGVWYDIREVRRLTLDSRGRVCIGSKYAGERVTLLVDGEQCRRKVGNSGAISIGSFADPGQDVEVVVVADEE